MNTPRVLVIEDDRATSALVAALAQHDGMEVETVFDGDDALDKLLYGEHRAVVLDLLLPGTGGVELLRELAERRPDHLQRIIVLTAADAAVRDEASALQPRMLIPKPFDLGELLEAMRHCCWQ